MAERERALPGSDEHGEGERVARPDTPTEDMPPQDEPVPALWMHLRAPSLALPCSPDSHMEPTAAPWLEVAPPCSDGPSEGVDGEARDDAARLAADPRRADEPLASSMRSASCWSESSAIIEDGDLPPPRIEPRKGLRPAAAAGELRPATAEAADACERSDADPPMAVSLFAAREEEERRDDGDALGAGDPIVLCAVRCGMGAWSRPPSLSSRGGCWVRDGGGRSTGRAG